MASCCSKVMMGMNLTTAWTSPLLVANSLPVSWTGGVSCTWKVALRWQSIISKGQNSSFNLYIWLYTWRDQETFATSDMVMTCWKVPMSTWWVLVKLSFCFEAKLVWLHLGENLKVLVFYISVDVYQTYFFFHIIDKIGNWAKWSTNWCTCHIEVKR